MERNWPTREEWAKQHRSTAGWSKPNPAKKQASLYATADEIAAIVTALKQSYNAHGRKLWEAKEACPDLVAQVEAARKAKEPLRWSDEDRARYRPVYDAEDVRRTINAAVKVLTKHDRVPYLWQEGRDLPELAELVSRYEAACEPADEAWRAEVAQRPIDDAAWEKELQRRRCIDDRLGRKGAA
jgi:hypothetical protein